VTQQQGVINPNLPATGHRSGFQTQRTYFQTLGPGGLAGGLGRPGAGAGVGAGRPGGGGAAGGGAFGTMGAGAGVGGLGPQGAQGAAPRGR
jgi:hypothetical protein